MSGEIHDECGVAAVYLKENGQPENKALFYLYKLLLNLQNRGQLSAGITTFNKNRKQILDTYRNIGTVNEVFRTNRKEQSMSLFKRYAGNKGIGHVRYATFGKDLRMYAQPFERHHGRLWKWFSFCFNGNLVNYAPLKEELEKKSEYHFILENDTEIIMHYIARELAGSKSPSMKTVFSNLSKKFEGAYNICLVNAKGELVVMRDPLGFRPLSYSIKDGNLLVASESNALINCNYENFKTLEPGKMIQVENGCIDIKRCAQCKKKAHCMFEWVYFANVSSVLNGKSVYLTRTNLGKELAKLETEKITKDHIVVPVPDSAKPSGDSLAYELGVPAREGLIRNRFVGRTFIEGGSRKSKVQNKYTMVKEVLKGKKVILVDDSIVRGATSEQLVKSIKEDGGAKEVHVRVSCPPILGPCFYGIDMSTVTELIAPGFMKEVEDEMPEGSRKKLAEYLGADSIMYQTIPGLVRSIGLSKNELCMACLNREYPTPTGRELIKVAMDNFRKGKKVNGRTYENVTKCGC
jgi:amidophosphoribosyltransferase